jgi:hypothetical protein
MTVATTLQYYPGATPARVPFTVKINPCEVTTFDPPTDIKMDY